MFYVSSEHILCTHVHLPAAAPPADLELPQEQFKSRRKEKNRCKKKIQGKENKLGGGFLGLLLVWNI